MKPNIERIWAMPNKNTFDVKPIAVFVEKYLSKSKISIDPFARNKRWATYTNDLNPDTKSEYHLKAEDFLKILEEKKVSPDVVLFDPPYSLEQCKRSYESFGYKFTYNDSLYAGRWTEEKNIISRIMPVGGWFIHFGWHTNGIGMNRGYALEEILIVCHGGAHYDTLCMAERKTSEQLKLF